MCVGGKFSGYLSKKLSLFRFDQKRHLVSNRDLLSVDGQSQKTSPPGFLPSIKGSLGQTISTSYERSFVVRCVAARQRISAFLRIAWAGGQVSGRRRYFVIMKRGSRAYDS